LKWYNANHTLAKGRFKVGAIDAAALGPFLKQARVKKDKNFLET